MMVSTDIEFFQSVWLKTDQDQQERLVTKITLHPGPRMVYELSCGMNISVHYREEFTTEEDTAKKLITI